MAKATSTRLMIVCDDRSALSADELIILNKALRRAEECGGIIRLAPGTRLYQLRGGSWEPLSQCSASSVAAPAKRDS